LIYISGKINRNGDRFRLEFYKKKGSEECMDWVKNPLKSVKRKIFYKTLENAVKKLQHKSASVANQ